MPFKLSKSLRNLSLSRPRLTSSIGKHPSDKLNEPLPTLTPHLISSTPNTLFPFDVLLHIFDCLALDVWEKCQQAFLDVTNRHLRGMRHIHRGDTYTTLRHASLTCKWWYPAAMQALSTHVLLVDGRQTRLFAKLVKRNPRLTSSVRSLSYVDTLDNKIFYSSGLSEDRLPDRIESNIAFILQICDNIDTISFSLRASLTSLTHMRWRREPPIIMHIRSLTLHGHALDTRTGDLVFPVLEYLSLRSIDSWDNINITRSIFPKLREIALVHPYNLEDMHNAAVKVASLQTLRSLAFIHAPSFSHGFSFPHIPQLSRLYIMGRSPSIDFGWLPSASSPLSCNRLQHLTFGIVDPISSNALKGWVLPPMLESLTVYIGDIEARRFDCLLRNIEPTAFLYNFLEANTLEIRSRVFRTLVVHILDPGGDSIVERSQFVASAIERVEKMCNWLGVTFVLQQSALDHWEDRLLLRWLF